MADYGSADNNLLPIFKDQHIVVVSKEGDATGWWKGRFGDQVRKNNKYVSSFEDDDITRMYCCRRATFRKSTSRKTTSTGAEPQSETKTQVNILGVDTGCIGKEIPRRRRRRRSKRRSKRRRRRRGNGNMRVNKHCDTCNWLASAAWLLLTTNFNIFGFGLFLDAARIRHRSLTAVAPVCCTHSCSFPCSSSTSFSSILCWCSACSVFEATRT